MRRVHIPTDRGLLDRLRVAVRTPGTVSVALPASMTPVMDVLAIPLTLIPTSQIARLARLIAASVSSQVGEGDLGACVACGEPVSRDEPFLRYGGEYYHAGACLEADPPALRADAQLVAHDEDIVAHLRPTLSQETVWVLPIGELDVATVNELDARVQVLITASVQHVVIDLRGLSFIDSSGVEYLTSIASHAQRDGWQLSLIQGAPAVRRVFAHTRTLRQLPFAPVRTFLGR
jgi:anti-sigma B factor antagonist